MQLNLTGTVPSPTWTRKIIFNNTFHESYHNSSYEANNTEEYFDDDFENTLVYRIGDFLTHYYIPALVVFGSIGNLLSVVVFSNTKLRKLSSSYYLSALSISDTCFLIGTFVSWLNYIDINIYNRDPWCQTFTYLSGFCSFMSVWFVVAFTFERFIAVLYPLKRLAVCTVERAISIIIGLIVIGSIISIPLFVYAAPQHSEYLNDTICDVLQEYKRHMQIYNYIDTVIVFVIPFTTIVTLNACTAVTVWKVAGIRRSMTMTKRKLNERDLRKRPSVPASRTAYTHIPHSKFPARQRAPEKSLNSSQIKATRMLSIVSTVFVCLNLPSYIMRIKAFLVENDENSSRTTIIIQYISWFLFITNFGINFVLYCLSGQNFRKAVVSMFLGCLKKHSHADAALTQVTNVTVSECLRSSHNASMSRKRRVLINNTPSYDIQDISSLNSCNISFKKAKTNGRDS